MKIRKYKASDCIQIYKLFYDTVHTVNARDYSREQLNVWAKEKCDLQKWNLSFLRHYTLVAEEKGRITGFGDIDNTGYLDRLYVHRDYQGRGIASALCDRLEAAVGTPKIITHASITAKPFFEHRGYTVVKKQQVIRDGISLTNYVMEKQQPQANDTK